MDLLKEGDYIKIITKENKKHFGKWQDVKFLKNPNSKRALGKITAFDAETGIATITLNKFGKKWKWEESLPKAFSCGYQPKQK
jgi:hypothetical protein